MAASVQPDFLSYIVSIGEVAAMYKAASASGRTRAGCINFHCSKDQQSLESESTFIANS
jgi:hypothetical protein